MIEGLTIEHVNTLAHIIDTSPNTVLGLGIAEDAILILKTAFCQSENKHQCSGELWECERCGKIMCCIEGGDGSDLCDDCWAEEVEAELNEPMTVFV